MGLFDLLFYEGYIVWYVFNRQIVLLSYFVEAYYRSPDKYRELNNPVIKEAIECTRVRTR